MTKNNLFPPIRTNHHAISNQIEPKIAKNIVEIIVTIMSVDYMPKKHIPTHKHIKTDDFEPNRTKNRNKIFYLKL